MRRGLITLLYQQIKNMQTGYLAIIQGDNRRPYIQYPIQILEILYICIQEVLYTYGMSYMHIEGPISIWDVLYVYRSYNTYRTFYIHIAPSIHIENPTYIGISYIHIYTYRRSSIDIGSSIFIQEILYTYETFYINIGGPIYISDVLYTYRIFCIYIEDLW